MIRHLCGLPLLLTFACAPGENDEPVDLCGDDVLIPSYLSPEASCGQLNLSHTQADYIEAQECVTQAVAAGSSFWISGYNAIDSGGSRILYGTTDGGEAPYATRWRGEGAWCTSVSVKPDCEPGQGRLCLVCEDETPCEN